MSQEIHNVPAIIYSFALNTRSDVKLYPLFDLSFVEALSFLNYKLLISAYSLNEIPVRYLDFELLNHKSCLYD